MLVVSVKWLVPLQASKSHAGKFAGAPNNPPSFGTSSRCSREWGLRQQGAAGLYASLADLAFLKNGPATAAAKARLAAVDRELAESTARWERLGSLA